MSRKEEETLSEMDSGSSTTTKALKLRAYGIVQRVGFRRYVDRTAWKFRLSGYVENLRDGSVRIFVQGPPGSLDNFVSEIKAAPSPIVIDKLDSQDAKVLPSIKHFQIKSSTLANEIQEGFGGMETQFFDYRQEFRSYRDEFRSYKDEFKQFASRTDQNFKSLNDNFNDYRGEFRSYTDDFGQFANRTDQNFKTLEEKYGEISAKLTQVLETVQQESNLTRKELTRAVDNLVAVVQKFLSQDAPKNEQ